MQSNIAEYSGLTNLVAHLVDQATVGILVESEGMVTYANPAYAELLGYRSARLLIRLPVESLVSPQEAPRLMEFGRLRVSGGPAPSAYDFDARRQDDSTCRLQASVFTSFVEGNAFITTVARPVEKSCAAPDTLEDVLSPRERETMTMILAGKRIKEIALRLDISEKTVCTHRLRMFKKLKLQSNHDLFRYGVAHKLLDWRA
ncbi:MAG TPA: LuxR C-terminal-related transcriptional regulator [Thermoanaerobaculia bacterium]|nr:LuxR C-terminal-related transcriptional regulator [Thermoanaerobaculia bacterium]